MKRFGAQGLFSYAIFFICLSMVLFVRAGEWWEAPDWRPTSSDEEVFVQGYPDDHQYQEACRQGRVDIVEYWLNQKGFRPNDEFISGIVAGDKVSGLFVASHKGRNEVVKLLVEAGADLNQTWHGITPLFQASQNGHAKVVKALVTAGADLNQIWNGATPLFKASQNGHTEVVKVLVKAGADLNQTWNGITPLLQASQNGHTKVAKVLVKAGADLNQTWNGATPLFKASQNGHAKVVQVLVKAGADLNQPWNGATPLYQASLNGHAKVVQVLVHAKADLNQTWDDVTPLFQASQNGHAEVVQVLVDAGANLNQADDDGATPLYMASQNGHAEVVEILVKNGANPLKKWHLDALFTKSPLTAAKYGQPFRQSDPEAHARYASIIQTLKPAIKVWKEQKKIQTKTDGNTGCFDGFVDMMRHDIKHTLAPLMRRISLKSTAH